MPSIAMPVERYEHQFWRPDRDYFDGLALERRSGLMPHGIAVSNLLALLGDEQIGLSNTALLSVRTRIRPDRYRCIDVCVVSNDTLGERFILEAPLLCIEVLQGESLKDMLDRVADYRELGCKHIWLFDPFGWKAWASQTHGMKPVVLDEKLTVPGTRISATALQVFGDLPGPERWKYEPPEVFEPYTEDR